MANLTIRDADNRLVEFCEDLGNGEGVRTVYDPETGNVESTEAWVPPPGPVNRAQLLMDTAAAAAEAAAADLPEDNPLRLAVEALYAATSAP